MPTNDLCVEAGLDEFQTNLVTLKAQGLGYAAIAKHLGKPLSTVRYHVRKALRAIADYCRQTGQPLPTFIQTKEPPFPAALRPLRNVVRALDLSDDQARIVLWRGSGRSLSEIAARLEVDSEEAAQRLADAFLPLFRWSLEAGVDLSAFLPAMPDEEGTSLTEIAKAAGLTQRHLEALWLIADGYSLAEAAYALRLGRGIEDRIGEARALLRTYAQSQGALVPATLLDREQDQARRERLDEIDLLMRQGFEDFEYMPYFIPDEEL